MNDRLRGQALAVHGVAHVVVERLYPVGYECLKIHIYPNKEERWAEKVEVVLFGDHPINIDFVKEDNNNDT